MVQITESEMQERNQALLAGGKPTPEAIAENTRSLVGYTYTVDDYYEVGREEIRKHALAVQDANPVHWAESAARARGHGTLIAAPTFIGVLGIVAQRKLFAEVITGYDLWQLMQTDQRLVYHQPIKVGDRLVCDASIDSFRHVTGPETIDLMVTKNIIWNQHDEPVMTTWTSLVARPGMEIDPMLAASLDHVMMTVDRTGSTGRTVHADPARYELPDPTATPAAYGAIDFDDLSVGQELPPKRFRLTRGNLVNYAGVAGDPNPIHFSDHVASAAGMDGVVAHGMQTMGLGAAFVSEFIGDPGAFCEYRVRFTSPVYVPADDSAAVDYTGKIRSLDPETRQGVIAIVAKQGDRKIFGRAHARIQFN
ncbi:MAG: fused (3R)-hydroxyacyl-ACP dehydratase subunits HadA/HadB [Gordonia sp. (in: high G+C Gram-positive bacteria)]